MMRLEFLEKLREALENDLNGQVVRENVDYYNTYISEEIRKGRREEDVVDELGDPWVIARSLIDVAEASWDTQGQSGYQQNSYGSYEPNRAGTAGGEGHNTGGSGVHVFGLDTWWKKLLLILGIIGVFAIVIAVIGGIFTLIAPLVVPVLVLVLVLRLFGGRRR